MKSQAAYSCLVVCAAPQAPENRVKNATAEIMDNFRPNMSLNLAHMTRKPVNEINRNLLVERFRAFTCVCQQISYDNPATMTERLEVIGDCD